MKKNDIGPIGSLSERSEPFSNRDIDETLRKRNESESFNIQVHGFVIVDLIPYERKEEMISNFQKLFPFPAEGTLVNSIKDQIKDINEIGISSYRARLGSIYNSNKLAPFKGQPVKTKEGFIYDGQGVKADLPEEIESIEVWIAQDVDFCYYVYYFCIVNEDYRKIKRELYIHRQDTVRIYDNTRYRGSKPKGPDSDSTLSKYETRVAIFLSRFVNGIFINKNFIQGTALPSLRILSTPVIDFTNLSGWGDKYELYLRYMGMGRYFNPYQRSIISFQTERIFKKSNVSKGLTILYSERDLPDNGSYGTQHKRIISNASVTNDALIDFFLPLYWSNFQIYHYMGSWNLKLKDMLSHVKSTSLTLQELESNVIQTMDLFGKFSVFRNKEMINIRNSRKNFNFKKRLVGPPTFTVHLLKFDIFKQLSDVIEKCFAEEETNLDDIQKQLDALTSYNRDLSTLKLSFNNLKLQKKVTKLTITIAIIGIAIPVLTAIVMKIMSS